MITAGIEGFLMGLFLSVFIGPVFFLLIETSIKKGIKEAFIMDAGVILSDIMWILLLGWGLGNYLESYLHSPYSMQFAGLVFVLFGLIGLLSKKRNKQASLDKKRNLFIQGFFLNTVNPSVALFWLATLSFALKQFHQETNSLIIFFSALFITVIFFDALKFYSAFKLGRFLTQKRQAYLSKVTSFILIAFGLYMVISQLPMF